MLPAQSALQSKPSRPSLRACSATAEGARTSHSFERVLRYPDGSSRRIVYPAEPAEDGDDAEYEPWSRTWWQNTASAPIQAPRQPAPQLQQPERSREAFNFFSWADIRKQAETLGQRVKDSYQVLHGCPWVLPQPMYVLTISHGILDSTHRFYSMQVRMPKSQDITDELARVLGNATLASSISMSDMKEGVVAFSSRAHAERYVAGMVAEDDNTAAMEVHICEVGSHELFRLVVGEAQGCVVALGFGSHHSSAQAAHDPGANLQGTAGVRTVEPDFVPSPSQLATSLRGQSSWGASSSSMGA